MLGVAAGSPAFVAQARQMQTLLRSSAGTRACMLGDNTVEEHQHAPIPFSIRQPLGPPHSGQVLEFKDSVCTCGILSPEHGFVARAREYGESCNDRKLARSD